jgi:hypothetical protein
VNFPGIDIELSKVLHPSEAVTMPAPLPPRRLRVLRHSVYRNLVYKAKAAVVGW